MQHAALHAPVHAITLVPEHWLTNIAYRLHNWLRCPPRVSLIRPRGIEGCATAWNPRQILRNIPPPRRRKLLIGESNISQETDPGTCSGKVSTNGSPPKTESSTESAKSKTRWLAEIDIISSMGGSQEIKLWSSQPHMFSGQVDARLYECAHAPQTGEAPEPLVRLWQSTTTAMIQRPTTARCELRATAPEARLSGAMPAPGRLSSPSGVRVATERPARGARDARQRRASVVGAASQWRDRATPEGRPSGT